MKNKIQINAIPMGGDSFKITNVKCSNGGSLVCLCNAYGYTQTFGTEDIIGLIEINDLLQAGAKIVLTA